MPSGEVLLQELWFPLCTNLMDDLGEIGTACFILKMKLLRNSVILCKTVSCLNLYLPYWSNTLQVPQMCVVVDTSLIL